MLIPLKKISANSGILFQGDFNSKLLKNRLAFCFVINLEFLPLLF